MFNLLNIMNINEQVIFLYVNFSNCRFSKLCKSDTNKKGEGNLFLFQFELSKNEYFNYITAEKFHVNQRNIKHLLTRDARIREILFHFATVAKSGCKKAEDTNYQSETLSSMIQRDRGTGDSLYFGI